MHRESAQAQPTPVDCMLTRSFRAWRHSCIRLFKCYRFRTPQLARRFQMLPGVEGSLSHARTSKLTIDWSCISQFPWSRHPIVLLKSLEFRLRQMRAHSWPSNGSLSLTETHDKTAGFSATNIWHLLHLSCFWFLAINASLTVVAMRVLFLDNLGDTHRNKGLATLQAMGF